jgi:predicted dehydrogenase
VKEILDAGVLGRITHVDMREGGVFGWKVASDFMFRRESGGGVLADIGIHTLDLLLWWLGDATDVAYRDDARGGVEADCELRLELASGASAVVELSRLRRMRNSYVVTGERGTLEIGIGVDPEIRIGTGSDVFSLQGNALRAGRRDGSLHAVFERQLADFVQAIESNAPPFVPGTEGARAVRLIEACRRVRELLVHPWSVGAAARSATS